MTGKKLRMFLMVALFSLTMVISGFNLVQAKGPKNTPAIMHSANIAIIEFDIGDLTIGFGLFDKMKSADLGEADCFDFFVFDNVIEDYVMAGVVTDSEDYQEFYDEVFAGLFPPAVIVDPEVLNVWKQGSYMYAELTEPVTIIPGVYVVPAFTATLNSVDKPYHESADPMPLPTGWTFSRIIRRGYTAIVTFDCADWGFESAELIGETQFNSLDIFMPPV